MTGHAEPGVGYDLLVPARTVVGEARGEDYEGKLAVACVIRNRAENPRWWGGPDWDSVCLKPWQFSCFNDPKYGGQPFLWNLQLDDIAEQYPDCLSAVEEVKKGAIDLTGNATHYVVTSWLHDPDLRPAWANELVPTVVIGHHSFFSAL